MYAASRWERIKTYLFYLFPHHWMSCVVFLLSRIDSYLAIYPIRSFIRHFNVNMSEAEHESPLSYPNFNAFFTRALKADARPICQDEQAVASPCDGTVMQIGSCEEGSVIQAKGREYNACDLVGGDHSFDGGKFCTIYLLSLIHISEPTRPY